MKQMKFVIEAGLMPRAEAINGYLRQVLSERYRTKERGNNGW
jgi:hypothetical protein